MNMNTNVFALIECSKLLLQQLQASQALNVSKDKKISELQSELDKYKNDENKVDSALMNKINFELGKDKDYIVTAAEFGLVEEIKILLKDPRVNPAVNENSQLRSSALAIASENGHSKVVKLLLADPRVNPAADDNFAIRYASSNGHSEVVKLLLADSRVDPSADDNYAIGYASSYGHTEVVQLLLADPRVSK